jgi:hypothetical protein
MRMSRYLKTTRRKLELQASANFHVRYRCESFPRSAESTFPKGSQILLGVRDWPQDQSQHVRASLSNHICDLGLASNLFRMTTVLAIKVRDLLFGRVMY